MMALRFFHLSTVPSGLQNDEASFLINAVSLKETGKDEDGRRLPLYLNSFIDPKPALFSYIQIPFLAVFGENTFAARLPSALFGLLSLGFIYLICRRLMSQPTALLIVMLLALSPWHIMLSRATQEVILAFFFSTVAIWAMLEWIAKKHLVFAAMMFSSMLLAMYTYHSAKVALPLILISTALVFGKNVREKTWSAGGIVACAAVSLVLTTFIFAGGLDRLRAVSVFTDPGVQSVLNEQITTATPFIPGFAIRVFHNKAVNYGRDILQRYGAHFTSDFLFIIGGEPQRYVIPFHGLLYLVELPLLLVGIFSAIRAQQAKDRKVATYMALWLLLAPIPDAITTQEHPSMIRTALMVVPLMYFVARGILWLWEAVSLRWRPLLLGGIVFLYALSMAYFVNQLFIQQPAYHPWHRNRADEHMVELAKQLAPDPTPIFVTTQGSGQPYVYFALGRVFSLEELQQSAGKRVKDFRIGRVSFIADGCAMPMEGGDPQVLYISRASCEAPVGYTIVGEASFDDRAEVYVFHRYFYKK